MPQGWSQYIKVGDVLAFARWMTPGSPATDKEPYLGFRKVDDPFTPVCRRNYVRLRVMAPLSPEYNGREIQIINRALIFKTMKMTECKVRFEDTKEWKLLKELPLDWKFLVLDEGGM